jgi:small subunit ribosomal protein S20
MPNNKQAKKRVRQDAKRRLTNRTKASAMRTAMRRVREAVEAGDESAVKVAVNQAYKRIDKASKTNVIHANTAARRKSLVARTATRGASA